MTFSNHRLRRSMSQGFSARRAAAMPSMLPWLGHRVSLGLVAVSGLAACGTVGKAPPPNAGAATETPACSAFRPGQPVGEGVITATRSLPASTALPAYCEVTGRLPTKTSFVIRMPANWNQRTVYVGGGGFNGALPAANAPYLKAGFAQISSTGGNDVANTANFAVDPLALNDYAYLSVHRTFQVGREIVRTYYAANETKNYFFGCSNGGREGLIAAQRWPQDFDGIIAAAPATHLQSLFLGFTRTNKRILAPGGNLSTAKLATLNHAVLAACDAQDGAADGVLGQPQACRFDPATLRCGGQDSDACLTDPQIDTVKALYGPYDVAGKRYLQGFLPGSETTWDGTQTGQITEALPRYSNLFADQWVRYFVTQDPNAKAQNFEPERWLPRISQLALLSDATDATLTNFKAREGKLILYHGLADAAISPKDTQDYYQQVVQAAGGQAQGNGFVRAYFNPGVGHCSGGPGADTVDLLTPLVNWVEKGIDPATTPITATKQADGRTVMSRPLCAYPSYPRYKGAGPMGEAASFTCASPQ